MSRRTRAGFTLPEALVAGAMFLAIAAAFFFTWSGARREEELASLHLSLLENASLALGQLRADLREMVVLSYAPVEGTSLKVSTDGSAIMLRQGGITPDPAGPCVIVEYRLAEAASVAGLPRYHLVRTRRTSNGAVLPFHGGRRESTEYKTFLLAGAQFDYLPPRLKPGDPHGDDHVVHVAFKVVSDAGRADGDAMGEKTMLLTQVMRFLKPPNPREFAYVLNVPGLETPPVDVLSGALAPVTPLPPFEEQ